MQVTANYNSKDNFDSLSVKDRSALVIKLEDDQKDLNDLNVKIQNLKFCISDDDPGLEAELKSRDDYNDKIEICLGSLEVKHTVPSPNIEDARTLLKSSIAPLPTFSSTSDEDITRFFHIRLRLRLKNFSRPSFCSKRQLQKASS